MANFKTSLRKVRIAEGGYQKMSADVGNYNSHGDLVGTNHGISAKTLERHLGFPITENQMRNLSWRAARAIYKINYWDRIKGDLIEDQAFADLLFDAAVNHGVIWASVTLQSIIGAKQDGTIGPKTLGLLGVANIDSVYRNFYEARERKYRQIAENYPSQRGFLRGWMNRLKKFLRW